MIHWIIYYSCWGCHHVVPFTAVCTFLVLGLFLVGNILAGIWYWVTLLNWCYCGARCAFNNYTAMYYFISDLSWGIIMIIILQMIISPTWKWGILVSRRSPVCPSVCPSVCGQNRVRSVTAKIHNGMRSGRFYVILACNIISHLTYQNIYTFQNHDGCYQSIGTNHAGRCRPVSG